MRAFAIAALAATVVAFGAYAQSQQGEQSSGTSAKSQTSGEQAGGQSSGKQAGTKSQTSGKQASGSRRTSGSADVNVRANVRGGSSHRTVMRERHGGTAVIHKRSRTTVGVADDEPSVSVIKKKKRFAKKRTHIYATAPSSRLTIVEKRRRGIIASGVSHERTAVRTSSRTSARVGVNAQTRTTTGSSTRTSSETTGSGSARSKSGGDRSSNRPARGSSGSGSGESSGSGSNSSKATSQ